MLRERKNRDELDFVTSPTPVHTSTAQVSTGATSGKLPGQTVTTTVPTLRKPDGANTLLCVSPRKDNMAPPALTDMVSHSDFVKTTDKIIEKLDLLNSNVTTIHKEVAELRANISDLQAAVADSTARLTHIENDALPKMQKKSENLESELKQMIMALELHDRKMNLLIYGMEKKKEEKVVEVVRKAIEELGFSKEESEGMLIANAHRLPRRVTPGNEHSGRGHDPIIVRFGAMFDRDLVLNAYQQRARLRQMTPGGQASSLHIPRFVTDLPAALKRKRFLLEQRAYQMRKMENKSTRIKLIGTNLQLECREKGSSSPWRAVID